MKITKYQRRNIITVMVILGLAITGLLVINTDNVTAEKIGDNTLNHDTAISGNKPLVGSSSIVLPSMLRLLSALIIVIGCIYGGIYLLKRVMNRRYTAGGGQHSLEVLETSYIGPKKTVSLIRVGDKAVLIGMTETNMSPLAELDTEQTAAILSSQEITTAPERDFKGILKSAVGKLREVSLGKHRTALDT